MTIAPTHDHPHRYPSAAPFDRTIPRVFADTAGLRPEAPAVVDEEVRLDLAGLAAAAAGLQARLRDAGVGRGDVVTAQLPNWWETIAALHAIWGLGAVINPVTPIYRSGELRAILRASRPAAVLAPTVYRDVDYQAMIGGALADIGRTAAVLPIRPDGRSDSSLLGSTAPFEVATGGTGPDDVAMLLYTSGTTGRPKGVLHSHRTLLYEAASIAATFGLRGDAVFMPSPLAHITGMLYGVLMPLGIAGHVVLLDRWDADRAVEVVEREHCTMTVSATPFLRGLADSYERRGERSSLRTFVCGGADIPAALVGRAERVMGTSVSRTYGSTEMPTLCIVRPGDPPETRLRTEGSVIGEARARLGADVRGDDGAVLGADVGELEVSGPELFVGYLDPADNLAAFTADGWFRTGDLARIDAAGEITITGRVKDLIIRGGENISAKEVEDLLATHAAIDDVAVVAVPDDRMGERACAVVVTSDPMLGLAEITRHLEGTGIARQKYPEALLVVDSLPRTVSGKVQKFALRALAATELGAAPRGGHRVEQRPVPPSG